MFGFINLPELLVRLIIITMMFKIMVIAIMTVITAVTKNKQTITMKTTTMSNKPNNKNNTDTLKVNQQNHMVANKFDPRMDPVVVQVIHIIALK